MSTEEPSHTLTGPPKAGWRSLLLALALFAAACLLTLHRHQPPPVVEAGAPDSVFSAERAMERLKRLLGDETPHPLGTAENDAVRERLIHELESLGLQPKVNEHRIPQRSDWVSDLHRVRNVIATLPSTAPDQRAVVLAAHYDSVPAGPGAGDDGAGVAAILETARALLSEGPLPRPVILLFTDGEELGLLGARAFCENNPLADGVEVVLNVEARGTSGASLMFETSPGNRSLIVQLKKGLKRPISSSAYVQIYQLMPNSSDLTVFMQRGLPGMNFAFIGTPRYYHTPFDNTANLDPRSLQHHGDNLLGITRAFLATDRDSSSNNDPDMVYTDIAAAFVVAWPANRRPIATAIVFLVLLFCLRLMWKRHRWTARTLSSALASWIVIILASTLFTFLGVKLLLLSGALPTSFPASMHRDLWFLLLFGATGIVLSLLALRPDPWLLWFAHALFSTLTSLTLAFTLPGFSYLWFLPALTAAVAGFVILFFRPSLPRLPAIAIAVTLVTAAIWAPLFPRLPLALGISDSAPVLGAALAMLLLPLLPLAATLSRRVLALSSVALLGASALFFAFSVSSPPFTERSPQHIGLFYTEEAGQETSMISAFAYTYDGSLPSRFTEQLEPVTQLEAPIVPPGDHFAAKSGRLPPPEVELLSRAPKDRNNHAAIRLKQSLPSQHLLVGIPEAVPLRSVTVAGRPLKLPPESRDGHHWVRIRGIEPQGVDVEFTWSGAPDLPLVVAGVTAGLPAHLASLEESRRELPACTVHRGDQTIVFKRVVLGEE